MPGTHVTMAVQIFIVVVNPGTLVTTTVQKCIVVVTSGNEVVTTTLQKFIVCYVSSVRSLFYKNLL